MNDLLFSEKELKQKNTEEPKPDYYGHRQRMRQKLLEKGAQSLSEAELLEMLLMVALPRRDVKPLAKQLLREYVNLPNIIKAEPERLREMRGIKDSVIGLFKLIDGICIEMLKPHYKKSTVLNEWNRIIDYCRFNLMYKNEEHLYLVYLDAKMRLITTDDFQKGCRHRVPIYPQEILKRALNLNAHWIIMVHNHPNGEARPSQEDIHQTEDVRLFLENGGIQLYDHLIIGRDKVYSFNSKKQLPLATPKSD